MTITLSQFDLAYIEKYIAKQSRGGAVAQTILSQDGILQDISSLKEWASDASAWVWEFANPGMMGFQSYENAVENDKVPTEKTGKLMSLAGLIKLGAAQIAQARQNSLGVNRGFEEMISASKLDFLRQIDGQIWNGDMNRYQRAGDPQGKYRTQTSIVIGLLNGTNGTHRTTISAGTGADDVVNAFGDFIDTAILAEATAAPYVDTERGFVVMDIPTAAALKKHRSATDESELTILKEMYPSWQFFKTDDILLKESDDVYTDMHKIAFIFPFDKDGQGLLKYTVSKNFHVQPCWGGNITNKGMFEWLAGWKGGIVAKSPYCVITSGATKEDMTVA